jgi:membrane protein
MIISESLCLRVFEFKLTQRLEDSKPHISSEEIMFAYFRIPVSWAEISKRTFNGVVDDDCMGLAAELAFYFFLAVFPALIFGFALLGFLPMQSAIQPVLDRLSQVAPPDVASIIEGQIKQLTANGGSTRLLTLGMLGAIWSSSSAIKAIMDTLNKVYEIKESRPWWKVRLIAIVLTIGIIVSFLISLAFVLVGPVVANWLDSSLRLGATAITLWHICVFIAAFFLAVLGVDTIYRFGPDAETRWVWITPGSLWATILWIACSVGFRVYVAHFGSYNAIYGAIGGIIVLMLWFYISGLSILVGAELDSKIDCAIIEKRGVPRRVGPRRKIGTALED